VFDPGPLETDMTKGWPPEVLDSLRQSMLIRQDELGTAEEIAHIIVFLCSEKASLIHGAQIDANGGIFIH
jgi:NAD(P)-dependent dehydrogenase (short-subunit alcohol dehydrogenase family)